MTVLLLNEDRVLPAMADTHLPLSALSPISKAPSKVIFNEFEKLKGSYMLRPWVAFGETAPVP